MTHHWDCPKTDFPLTDICTCQKRSILPEERDEEDYVDKVLVVDKLSYATMESMYDDTYHAIGKTVANKIDDEMLRQFHTSPSGGVKEVKLARFSLIPKECLWALAEHYGKGAKKYGDWNWSKGYDYSLSFDALCRHLLQWWGGEDIDEETGSHHLIAVAWHAFALYYFTNHFPEYDNRNKNVTH